MGRIWKNPWVRFGRVVYSDAYRTISTDGTYYVIHDMLTHTRRFYARIEDAVGMLRRLKSGVG